MAVQRALRVKYSPVASKVAIALTLLLILNWTSCHKNTLSTKDDLLREFDQRICRNEISIDYHNCYTNLLRKERIHNDDEVICIPSLKAVEYIESLDSLAISEFWTINKGGFKADAKSTESPMYFLGYSDSYIQWLETYSNTNDGRWVTTYLSKYKQLNDIPPSMIARFDSTLVNNNMNSDNVRLIALVHHLTIAYNYCKN